MLTTKDLQNIGNLLEVRLRPLEEDISILKENYQEISVSVDKIVKKLDDQEYAVLKVNDSKQDKKLQELAKHTNYTFES